MKFDAYNYQCSPADWGDAGLFTEEDVANWITESRRKENK